MDFEKNLGAALGKIRHGKNKAYEKSNESTEGKDEHYTYKAVCVVDEVPQVIDGFDCRQMIAVGRFKNAINTTGYLHF